MRHRFLELFFRVGVRQAMWKGRVAVRSRARQVISSMLFKFSASGAQIRASSSQTDVDWTHPVEPEHAAHRATLKTPS